MDDISTVFENARRVAARSVAEIVDYLPTLLGACIILLVGWGVARLLRAGTNRAGDKINRVLDRVFRSGRLAQFRLSSRMLSALAEVIFWLTLFVFVSIAARAAGLTTFAIWLDRMTANLPNIVAGVLVIIVGFFLGEIVRNLASAQRTAQGLLIGKALQIAVIVIALIVGLDLIGIDVTFIVTIAAVAIGVLLGGFAIAFGLGARNYVANLIGAHELRREIEPGQMIRVGETEGEVIEITATTIVLATSDGRRRIPAAILSNEQVTIVDAESPHG